MIVADANLIAHYVWRGAFSTVADDVWRRDPVWAVPPLWQSELRNALSLGLRRRVLSLDEALTAYERALRALAGRERPVASRAVFELVAASGCTAYDCEYVSLAAMLRVPLVTSDREILRAFPQVAVSPTAFAAGNP